MKCEIAIFRVSGKTERSSIEWDSQKTYDEQLSPLLGGNVWVERVPVIVNGRELDMFVDESGRAKSLHYNVAATQASGCMILGDAIVFLNKKVWPK